MEFQIGQIHVRILLNIIEKEIYIKSVYPISDHEMEVSRFWIKDSRENPVRHEITEYVRGDKSAEESAKY